LIGDLTGLLSTLKGLPLAYARDLQEDKEPIFDALDQLHVLIPAMTGLVDTLVFHPERLEALAPAGFSLATDMADWLVRHRIPFAQAHEITGRAVAFCEREGIGLEDLTDAQLTEISSYLSGEVRQVLTVHGAINARTGRGGTAEVRVQEQLSELDAAVTQELDRITTSK
jgi:argininosuccinate lyase